MWSTKLDSSYVWHVLFVLETKHAQLGYVLHVLFVLQTQHAHRVGLRITHAHSVESNMHKRRVLCATAV